MAIGADDEIAGKSEMTIDETESLSDDPGYIKLPAVLNHEAALDVLNAVKNAAAEGAAVCIDAGDVDRLHTPVAQILVSAAQSCDLAIRAPSDEFISACTDLGVWSLLSERIET